MRYEIFKERRVKIKRKEIDNIIKKTAKLFKIPRKSYLSIAFIPPDVIKRLNYQYRKLNKTTDVLSFNNQTDKSYVFDHDFIGEIFICYKQAICQAKKNSITINQEIKKILAHGLVHLMGYDHKTLKEKKEMRDKEMEILTMK